MGILISLAPFQLRLGGTRFSVTVLTGDDSEGTS